MAQNRGLGTGQIDRIMRRLGQVSRFRSLDTPSPGQQMGDPSLPPPPRPDVQAPPAAPVEGQQMSLDMLMDSPAVEPTAATPVAAGAPMPVAAPEPPNIVTESPATRYFRETGTMPNFIALSVLNAREELHKQTGRPPNKDEIVNYLSQRMAAADDEELVV